MTNTPATQVLDYNETPAYLAVQELFSQRQERGTFFPGSVDSLFATARSIHEEMDPQDIDRPLNQTLFRYVGGKAALQFRRPDGSCDPAHSLTRSALSQLGYRVLGGGGTKYVEQLRHRGTHGSKLAEVNWNYSLQEQQKPSLLRTVLLPGQTHRTIRAVLSGGGRGYSVVDNVDVLGMLADCPELAELPIISSKITPDYMKIRFLLNPADAALFDPETGAIRNPTHAGFLDAKGLPVPMGELWNGEIGNSAVRFQYGTFWFKCLNGMGSYGGDNSSWRWNHTGGDDRAERIKTGLRDALKSARVHATGQVEDYKAATEVAIDDAFALLDEWAGNDLSGDQLERTKDALADETTYPGKKLASIIDAVTLAAQGVQDDFKQRELEAFAARLLQKGLETAERSGGRITVAAA